MPGCCAVGCSNRDDDDDGEFKFILSAIPTKADRRKLWLRKIHREDFEPSSSARLFEVHFEADQWELHRKDGKRKLKQTAVPTLFAFAPPPKRRKKPNNRGGCSTWKPIQTGLILSTRSVLDLSEELPDSGHKFVLTGRLTQDCLENLFSVVRFRTPVPSPLEFKFGLRMITCSQFLKPSQTTSYDVDDSAFLADFLQPLPKIEENDSLPDLQCLSSDVNTEDLCLAERCSLYNLSGYCVHSVVKFNDKNSCQTCLEFVTKPDEMEEAHLKNLREFRQGLRTTVSRGIFGMLLMTESMFRVNEKALDTMDNVNDTLLSHAINLTKDINVPDCHNINRKILAKYISCRVNFHCVQTSQALRQKKRQRKLGVSVVAKA